MTPTKIHFFTGKGGVGKTYLAAAFAQALAKKGFSTLLCEINGGGALASQMQLPYQGYALSNPAPSLWMVDIEPAAAIREYCLMILRVQALYRLAFENPYAQALLRLVPSLGELVCLGKIWFHAQASSKPHFDYLVVDAPATGHALALLGSPMAVQAQLPAGAMRDNAHKISKMLQDPQQTQVHLVSLSEEFSITETCELLQKVPALGMRLGCVLLNDQTQPELPLHLATAIQGWCQQPALQPAAVLLAARLQRQQLAQAQTARLAQRCQQPLLRIPRSITPRDLACQWPLEAFL